MTTRTQKIRSAVNDHYILAITALIIATATLLWVMGQPLICPCGHIKFWHGLVDAQSSNHFTDWFTLQHFLTGMVIYAALRYAAPTLPRGLTFFIAVSVEAAWEILENTPLVIQRFRDTAHENYVGDAIINSVGDMLAMIPGYLFAEKHPWWASLTLGIAIELLTLYAIHDSVLLNVIMLIYPFEALRAWQLAAWP